MESSQENLVENKSEKIINWLTVRIRNHEPISPADYLDAAMKLNLLLSDEQAKLYELQQAVAQKKAELIETGNSVSKAKVLIEATDDYRNFLTQKAKIEQIIEFVRISKIQARMAQAEYQGY